MCPGVAVITDSPFQIKQLMGQREDEGGLCLASAK
jgi:hypothetical protein